MERIDLVRVNVERQHLVGVNVERQYLGWQHLVREHLEWWYLVGQHLVWEHVERVELDGPHLGPRKTNPLGKAPDFSIVKRNPGHGRGF